MIKASTMAITFTKVLVFFMITLSICAHSLPSGDIDLVEFPLNLEYMEAEFFAWGAMGRGLDELAPELAKGGPSPIGVKASKLDNFTKDVVLQFAYQEFGHLRAIQSTVKGFPRPLMDLSNKSFATVINHAFGYKLKPPFDPYVNTINYLIASYVIPYVGLTGYVGANSHLQAPTSKRLIAGLLGVESSQDAVIRTLLYEHAMEKVEPYDITVEEFIDRISKLRDRLGHEGVKDEGLVVKESMGAEGKIKGNVLAGDKNSVAYGRSPKEILRIVYGSGDKRKPGGFYPKGANGRIAKAYLVKKY